VNCAGDGDCPTGLTCEDTGMTEVPTICAP
jgi:hypothetical protein